MTTIINLLPAALPTTGQQAIFSSEKLDYNNSLPISIEIPKPFSTKSPTLSNFKKVLTSLQKNIWD